MRVFCASAFFLLFLLPVGAAAQTPGTRGSAGGMIGLGKTWDDEGNIGTGPVTGGRVEWRLFGTTGVEFSVDWVSHEREGEVFEANGHTTFVGASLVHRFGRSAVQPYVLGGLHVAMHKGSTRFDDVRTERSSTDLGYHFGGGVAFRITDRVEVGPEARFFMVQPENDSDPAFANWIGARAAFRF
jgi:opacity protein-like surface antigen